MRNKEEIKKLNQSFIGFFETHWLKHLKNKLHNLPEVTGQKYLLLTFDR